MPLLVKYLKHGHELGEDVGVVGGRLPYPVVTLAHLL